MAADTHVYSAIERVSFTPYYLCDAVLIGFDTPLIPIEILAIDIHNALIFDSVGNTSYLGRVG